MAALSMTQQNLSGFFLLYFMNTCGVSVSHNPEGHVHESHGHKTSLSEHGEGRQEEERKAERKGISFICSEGNVLLDLHTVVYLWCSK